VSGCADRWWCLWIVSFIKERDRKAGGYSADDGELASCLKVIRWR
jgi:hypothetical protein